MSARKVLPNEEWREYQYLHTVNRLRERYGLIIGRELYASLCKATSDSELRCVYSRNTRFEVRIVGWMSREIPVAWDIFHEVVASVLPKHNIEYFKSRIGAFPGTGQVTEPVLTHDGATATCIICGERYSPKKKTKVICAKCKGVISALDARPLMIDRVVAYAKLSPSGRQNWKPQMHPATEYPFFGYE